MIGGGMLQQHDSITLDAGTYRLERQLARSAYGVVWQARDGAGSPDVALKLINRAQMERADPALQDRWVASVDKEIAFLRTLAAWDERHIVRLLDSGTHQQLPVMALELMGADLGRLAAPAPYAQVLDWLGQINQALAKVHQYGWLYLDLKPANVLQDPNGRGVKLADFGTSRLRRELASAAYAGTASWQAPEQFFPGPRATYDTDPRTDYFALGALFYFLATGGQQLRFCSGCGEAWRTHTSAAAALLLDRHGGIPPTLSEDEAVLFAHRVEQQAGSAAAAAALALLTALLEPDPNQRPAHAIQISRLIDAARAREPLPRAVRHIARSAFMPRSASMA
jgi:eukaryotic-like serine/threonine-protein kinase